MAYNYITTWSEIFGELINYFIKTHRFISTANDNKSLISLSSNKGIASNNLTMFYECLNARRIKYILVVMNGQCIEAQVHEKRTKTPTTFLSR
jgi:hypothetical protein